MYTLPNSSAPSWHEWLLFKALHNATTVHFMHQIEVNKVLILGCWKGFGAVCVNTKTEVKRVHRHAWYFLLTTPTWYFLNFEFACSQKTEAETFDRNFFHLQVEHEWNWYQFFLSWADKDYFIQNTSCNTLLKQLLFKGGVILLGSANCGRVAFILCMVSIHINTLINMFSTWVRVHWRQVGDRQIVTIRDHTGCCNVDSES